MQDITITYNIISDGCYIPEVKMKTKYITTALPYASTFRPVLKAVIGHSVRTCTTSQGSWSSDFYNGIHYQVIHGVRQILRHFTLNAPDPFRPNKIKWRVKGWLRQTNYVGVCGKGSVAVVDIRLQLLFL